MRNVTTASLAALAFACAACADPAEPKPEAASDIPPAAAPAPAGEAAPAPEAAPAAAEAVVTPAAAPAAGPGVPAGTYVLDKTHASLHWRVSHLGLSRYVARFTDFDATIEFDPANPAASKLTATVNPASLETDFPYPEKTDFDAELRGAKFFNTAANPSITFTSTKIEVTGAATGTITGDLTFLGVTKSITLDVTLQGAANPKPFLDVAGLGFSAVGAIKRSDFGMTALIPNVGDEVTLLIEAEFNEKKS